MGADMASFAQRRIVTFFAGPQKITGGLHDLSDFGEVVRRGTIRTDSYSKSPQESLVAGATLSELHRSAFKLQQASMTVKHAGHAHEGIGNPRWLDHRQAQKGRKTVVSTWQCWYPIDERWSSRNRRILRPITPVGDFASGGSPFIPPGGSPTQVRGVRRGVKNLV